MEDTENELMIEGYVENLGHGVLDFGVEPLERDLVLAACRQ